METTKNVLSYIYECKGPPILLGDDTPVEVIVQAREKTPQRSFANVFHVPKLFVNIMFVYQIRHSSTGKRVEFTPNSVTIYDMHDN